jgi:superfamily I DNA/RNA helicase
MTRVWSDKQQAVFDFVENGEGNAVIKAVAGSGKTTTIVEAISRIPAGKSSIFLAFNKSIAEELKKRGVNSRTFHSLTYGPVTKMKNVRAVNTDKTRNIIDQMLGGDAWKYGAFLNKIVGLAKNAGVGALVPETDDVWHAIVEHHNLDVDHEDVTLQDAIGYASKVLAMSNMVRDVDFDDLLYLAVKDGVVLEKYDYVFVDEAQDTNAIQRAVLAKIVHSNSRLIAVGDPAQAIYGFRGSDHTAMDLIREEFDAIELPLTVTYRCPLSVVRHAQQWVDYIEAAPGAQEGSVTALGTDWDPKAFTAQDLVICRTTAPLVSLAYRMMKARLPVMIKGRDIGKGLVSLVNKMKAKGVDALIEKLGNYTAREVEKARSKKKEDLADHIQDKTDCVMYLIRTLDENHRTVPELIRVIEGLFGDEGNVTTLSTVHKAKGLEADRVYWLNSSKCPPKWAARRPWMLLQEDNICYVATTRAKQELILIEEA